MSWKFGFRREDAIQLRLVGFALVFLTTIVLLAQVPATQDGINAILFERLANMDKRLDRLESYMTAAIIALIANFVAHIVSIRSRTDRRHTEGRRIITEYEDIVARDDAITSVYRK